VTLAPDLLDLQVRQRDLEDVVRELQVFLELTDGLQKVFLAVLVLTLQILDF